MTFRVVQAKGLAILALLSLAVAAGAVPTAHAENGHDLVVAVQKLPDVIDSTNNSSLAKRFYPNIFDKLVRFDLSDKENPLKPGLATSWKRIGDAAVEVTVRQGVTFHNGDPMTIEDVAFSFGPEYLQNRAGPYWGNLKGVEITGTDTLVLTMNDPDPLLEYRLSGWAADIISKKAFLAAGNHEAWGRNPIGTGPYKITEIVDNDHIKLTANAAYWDGTPPAASVTFREVPEVAARLAGLASGEFDMITNVPPDLISQVDGMANASIVGGPIMNHRLLRYQQTGDPIMANVHFRRALTFAINRQLIVDALWAGKTVVPESHQFDEYGKMKLALSEKLYDPEKAKKELALSGYDGHPIKYALRNNYYTNQVATGQILQQMWRDVGINVEIAVYENGKQVNDANPALQDWSSSAAYPDPVGGLWRQWEPKNIKKQGGWWLNEEFNDLGPKLTSSTDLATRQKMWSRMLEIWTFEDPGGTVLHQSAEFYGLKKGIQWTPSNDHFTEFGPHNLSFAE